MFTNSKNKKDRLIKEIEANYPENRSAIFDMLRIDEADATKIAKALEKNSYLEFITFYDCQLDEEKIKILKDGIMKNKSLMDVRIEWFRDDSNLLKQMRSDIAQHLENNKNTYQANATGNKRDM